MSAYETMGLSAAGQIKKAGKRESIPFIANLKVKLQTRPVNFTILHLL